MKKFIILFLIFLVVGCSSNKVDKMICNYHEGNRDDIVTIYFKDNESTSYNKESNIIFDNSNEASNYKMSDEYDKIEVVDNIVTMQVSENIDNMTKDEIKSLYEKSGYICK